MTVRLLTNIGRLWTGVELISNAAIVMHDGIIAWVGPAADLPQSIPGVIDHIVDAQIDNAGGALVTPGLIDAHTHPVYAGNRFAEISARTDGASQSDIVAAGGGVSSTVTATRGTDPWTLRNDVRDRLRHGLRSGTTRGEAKTGSQLARDGELAAVRLVRCLEGEPGMPRLHGTLFAAPAVPPGYCGRPGDYVQAVGSWLGDAAQAGADGVDV